MSPDAPSSSPPSDAESNRADASAGDTPPVEELHQAADAVARAREYASHYIAAKTDQIRAGVQRAALYAMLGVLGLVAAVAAVVTAVTLLVIGIAQLISAALGQTAWAGNLIVGVAVAAVVGLSAWIITRNMLRASHQKLAEKYESRRQEQRTRFGRDAREQVEHG